MKHSIVRPFAIAALVCLGGSALAVGLTGHLDPIQAEVEDRVADLDGATDRPSKKLRKRLQKVLRGMEKKSLTKSLKNEVRGSRKVVKQLGKFLEGDQEIRGLVDDLIDDYRGEVDLARTVLVQQVAGLDEGTRKHKKAVKRLEKADQFLTAFESEDDDAKQLKWLLKAVAKTGEPDATGGDRFTFVLNTLSVAEGGGADLTGNGMPNNALSQVLSAAPPAATLATQAIQQEVAAGAVLLLIDAFGVDSTQDDVLFTLGVGPGLDSDANPDDNFDGNETFLVPGLLLDDEGRLSTTATGDIVGGVFNARVEGVQFTIPAGLGTISPIGPIVVEGALSANQIQGVLTFAISVADAQSLLDQFAPPEIPFPPGFVSSLRDVDTDGDTFADAISASFNFTGVPATISEQ